MNLSLLTLRIVVHFSHPSVGLLFAGLVRFVPGVRHRNGGNQQRLRIHRGDHERQQREREIMYIVSSSTVSYECKGQLGASYERT